MKKIRPELRTKALKMHKSLLSAVDKAGGSGASFSWDKLEHLSVVDLMDQLGTNGIRFIYRKPKRKEL